MKVFKFKECLSRTKRTPAIGSKHGRTSFRPCSRTDPRTAPASRLSPVASRQSPVEPISTERFPSNVSSKISHANSKRPQSWQGIAHHKKPDHLTQRLSTIVHRTIMPDHWPHRANSSLCVLVAWLARIFQPLWIGKKVSSRILIVDDHPMIREVLADLIRDIIPSATILQAGTVASAVKLIEEIGAFDLILVDLELPDAGGLLSLLEIRIHAPHSNILVLTAHEWSDEMQIAFVLGANGFLSKTNNSAIITNAILQFSGSQPPGAVVPISNGADEVGLKLPSLRQEKLTPQQARILRMLCDGHMNKVLAYEFSLTESTIKAHISGILRKLEVPNRTQAIVIVLNPFSSRRSQLQATSLLPSYER